MAEQQDILPPYVREGELYNPKLDNASRGKQLLDEVLARPHWMKEFSPMVKLLGELKKDSISVDPTWGYAYKVVDESRDGPAMYMIIGQGLNMMLQEKNVETFFQDGQEIESHLRVAAFQGFDAAKFYPFFISFAVALGFSGERIGLLALQIISAFIMRGTNIEKMKGKSTEEFKLMINRWISAGLVMKSTDPNAITIGRVVALFPQYTSLVLYHAHSSGLKDEIVPEGKTTLPVWLRFSGAPSLLTKNQWEALKATYREYLYEFTRIITRRAGVELPAAEVDSLVNKSMSIAEAQRKEDGFHMKRQAKYLAFLVNQDVITGAGEMVPIAHRA